MCGLRLEPGFRAGSVFLLGGLALRVPVRTPELIA